MNMKIKSIIAVALTAFSFTGFSQSVNFSRENDQRGVNKFETTKAADTVPFDGLKVKVGGAFTQQFQALSHSNTALPNLDTIGTASFNLNKLYPLTSGFNLAAANLRIDVQLADGIRVALENYMSSRHHSEFWVKGGYIQIDKLPMFGDPEWFSKYVTVKIGHFGINYGDQQFRRSDNGNTVHNAFVGNYILDAFTTEIGGEVYVYPADGLFLMAGATGGIINGDIKQAYLPAVNGAAPEELKKNPSILAKVGYDKQLTDDLRVRLTGSMYTNAGTTRNTLYAGDRTGSRYFMAAEPERIVSGGAFVLTAPAAQFTSGQINPNFAKKVTAVQVNPFIKFKGLELFGAYEVANGSEASTAAVMDPETRKFTQMAGEIVYRFLPREQVFIGARYNTVKGQLAAGADDISVDRTQLSAGWFATPNMLLKLEYVTQKYNDFLPTDYRNGLEFNGLMIEAAIAF